MTGSRDRGRELDELRVAINAGGSVLVSGPMGIGKSHLLGELVADRGDERCVLHASGNESAASTPFGAVASWLPDVDTTRQSSHLRVAIDHIIRLTQGRSPLLVVDDVHHLDHASLALLYELTVTAGIPLVAAVRSGHRLPPTMVELCAKVRCRSLNMGPLPEAALRRLVASHLTTPETRVIDELVARASGNPLFAIELARTHLAGGRGEVSGHLAELVRGRLAALSTRARIWLEHLAVVEPLPIHVIDGTEALDDAALLEAERAAFIATTKTDPAGRGDGDVIVRFAHPIYGELIRAGLSAESRRLAVTTLHDWVLTSGERRHGDAVHVASSLLRLGEQLDMDLAIISARESLAYQDAGLAQQLVDRALETGPDRSDTLLVAGAVKQALGDVAAADQYLQRAFENAATDDDVRDTAAALSWHRLRFLNDPAAAARVDEEAARRIGDPTVHDWLRLQASLNTSVTERYIEIVDRSQALLARPSIDPHVKWTLLLDVLFAKAQLGQLAGFDADVAAAEALVPEVGSARHADVDLLRHCRMLGHIQRGQLDEALSNAADWLDEADGSPTPTAVLNVGVATVRWIQGDVAAARQLLDLALDDLQQFDPQHGLPVSTYFRAMLAGVDGEFAVADEALALADTTAGAGYQKIGTHAARAAAWVKGWRDPHGAIELFAASTRIAIDETQYSWALHSIHDALIFDGVTAIEPMLKELEGFPVDAPFLDVMLSHSRARVDDDLPGIRHAAESFERAGAGWHAAGAWRAAAQLAPSTTGRARAATRAVMAGPRQALGAHADEIASSALTARRVDIATRAARGATDAAIADELGVSTRTVEDSLRHTYRTLGIDGRAELPTVLPPTETTEYSLGT